MTYSTMKQEIRDRLTILSTSTYITETMLGRWINIALFWACSFKKWPFMEKRESDLIDSTGTYPYPTGMKTGSIYLITVNGKRYQKIAYEDYLKYLEEHSSGDDKVWAEFDRNVYINGNACSVGDTVYFYGQEAATEMSLDADTSPFEDAEDAGDEAIIRKAVSIGLKKLGGHDPEAKLEEEEAKGILEMIWDRIVETKPRTVRKARPLLKKINMLKGTVGESGQDTVGKF